MSRIATTYRGAVHARRIVSILLSILTIAISVSILALLVVRPATYLSMGTFGLAPLQAFLLDSRDWLVLLPLAALGALIGMPKTDAANRPLRRPPLIVGIIAGTLCALTYLYPMVMLLLAGVTGIVGFLLFTR